MLNEEMLSVLDSAGRKVGRKPRAQVHRDGDWHALAFVWAARIAPDGRLRFLLQIRGRDGDRFAGHVDAPAGGHVLDQEDHLQSAIREFLEEVGIGIGGHELVSLEKRRVESLSMDCQRTFQHHYLCRRPLMLADVRLTDEVAGFVDVDLDEFAALVDGSVRSIAAEQITKEHRGVHVSTLKGDTLSLYADDVKETFRRVLKAAKLSLSTDGSDAGSRR